MWVRRMDGIAKRLQGRTKAVVSDQVSLMMENNINCIVRRLILCASKQVDGILCWHIMLAREKDKLNSLIRRHLNNLSTLIFFCPF